MEEVKIIANILYIRFQYTPDAWHRLYDSLQHPDAIFHKLLTENMFEEDCDGFHVALYSLMRYNFKVKLLTVITDDLKSSHTMLLLINDTSYQYIDYTYISQRFVDMNLLINDIQKVRYDQKDIIIINYELSQWNGKSWETY